HADRDVENTQVGGGMLKEGYGKLSQKGPFEIDEQADRQGTRDLKEKLRFSRDSLVILSPELSEVIHEPDGAEHDERRHGEPYVADPQICPEQCRNDGSNEDDGAAHRRRSFLGLVPLGHVLPRAVVDLPFLEFLYRLRGDQEAYKKRGE